MGCCLMLSPVIVLGSVPEVSPHQCTTELPVPVLHVYFWSSCLVCWDAAARLASLLTRFVGLVFGQLLQLHMGKYRWPNQNYLLKNPSTNSQYTNTHIAAHKMAPATSLPENSPVNTPMFNTLSPFNWLFKMK